tara:strand:- start:747 stop:1427 length:681 start_codon:yes stop_codon:yes gene_type:complete
MIDSYFFKQLQDKNTTWRNDELIILANEILKNKKIINVYNLQIKLSYLNYYAREFTAVKKKTHNDIVRAIELLKQNIKTLTNAEKETINQASNAIDVLLSTSIEFYRFEDLSDKNFKEGNKKMAFHFYRERNQRLIKLKKYAFMQKHDNLFCEACNFNFYEFYGDRGKDYAEIHHNIPLSSKDFMGSTHLDDLSVLCSNCHRMIHRHNPWLTLEELKTIIKKQVAA